MKNFHHLVFLLILFGVWPFGAFVYSFILLFKYKISDQKCIHCLLVISLFWGLLAFTQKTLGNMPTDCERYYESMEIYEAMSFFNLFNDIQFSDLINFVFYPMSFLITSLTCNVQFVSLFWVSISYFLVYIGIRKLVIYNGYLKSYRFAQLILILTFCFMLFVQMSELLKNSASFAVLFYGLAIFLCNGNKMKVLMLIILAIGIHPSVWMLLPLFLCKIIKTKHLIVLLFISLFLVQFLTAFINTLFNILPTSNYLKILEERTIIYYENQTQGTDLYMIIFFIMFCLSIYLWLKNDRKDNQIVNISLLYIIISIINYYNLVAFLRFSLLSHWIFGLLLVDFLRIFPVKYNKVIRVSVLLMFLVTMKYTSGRLDINKYSSSYMDNSLVNIIFSSSKNYLSVDYKNKY